MTKTIIRFVFMFGLMAALAFAQQSSFGRAAQGVSAELVLIARFIAIAMAVICGLGLMSGGPGSVAKISGFVLGAIFALFASPIITWIQQF